MAFFFVFFSFGISYAFASTDLGGNPPTSDPNSPSYTAYITFDDDIAHNTQPRSVITFDYATVLTPSGSCDVSTWGGAPNFTGCSWVSVASQGYVGYASDVTNLNGHGSSVLYPILRDPVKSVRNYGNCNSVFVCSSNFGLDSGPNTIQQYGQSSGFFSGGGIPIGVAPNTTTRFITFVVNPTAGTVTATGYWTASTTSNQSQELRFWQVSPNLGQEAYASRLATTTGNFSFSFPYRDTTFQISATSTSYTLGTNTTFHAEIYQLYSGFNIFTYTGTLPSLITSTSTSVTATTTATVVSNNPRSLSGLPEPSDCGLSAITGCIKNAVVWLFYPSSDSVDSFKNLSSTLSGKFPFAYAYGINAMRMELFEATQTSTTTISLNFKIIPGHGTSTLTLLSPALLNAVPYSSTVKTILGWILWLLGIEYIYYRVLRSHDPNTP